MVVFEELQGGTEEISIKSVEVCLTIVQVVERPGLLGEGMEVRVNLGIYCGMTNKKRGNLELWGGGVGLGRGEERGAIESRQQVKGGRERWER